MQTNLEKASVALQKIWKKSSIEVTAPVWGTALSLIAAGVALAHAIPNNLNEIGFVVAYLGFALLNLEHRLIQKMLAAQLDAKIEYLDFMESSQKKFPTARKQIEKELHQITQESPDSKRVVRNFAVCKKEVEEEKQHSKIIKIQSTCNALERNRKQGLFFSAIFTGYYLVLGTLLACFPPSNQSVLMSLIPPTLALLGNGGQAAGHLVAANKLKKVCALALG